MIRFFAAALLAAGSLATSAQAATTVVASGARGANFGTMGLGAGGPLGQSFVADDSGLSSFGFQFGIANSTQAAASVTFQLLSGAGLGGSVIATRSLNPVVASGRNPTWIDFDLTGTALTIGQSYTAVVSSTSTRLALFFGPATGTLVDAYTGGSLFSSQPIDSFCTNSGVCDANFRFTITPLAAAVPEPLTWLTLLTGMFVTGGMLRRRRGTFCATRTVVG